MEPFKILLVCLGNICRSPTAEGILRARAERRDLSDRFEFDSAGTGPWHVGEPPDPRAVQAAAARGYDLSALRGRQVEPADLERFDLVLAMDGTNLADLRALARRAGLDASRARRFLEFAPGAPERDVPDPYHGGADGFERVLDLIEAAADGLLDELEAGRLP